MKIIITGTTGVGKSTIVELLEKLIQKQNRPVIRMGELVVDSEFFDYYFNDISGWGFLSQTSFLLDRFKQWIEVERKINNYIPGAINIFDRHFIDDLIFSDLNWVKENVSFIHSQAYKLIYDDLLSKLFKSEKIDFLFLLKADFSTIKSRMSKRGRENETLFDEKYWNDLYEKYYEDKIYSKHFIKYSKKMILINTEKKDPLKIASEIFQIIQPYLLQST